MVRIEANGANGRMWDGGCVAKKMTLCLILQKHLTVCRFFNEIGLRMAGKWEKKGSGTWFEK
jgi:hypothetical protein